LEVGVIRLHVPGTLMYRNVALRVVTEACRMAQGREREGEPEGEGNAFEAQVVSAFSEAFNNIAIHGYAQEPLGSIDIEIGWNSDEVVIQMTDTGPSFDPDTIEAPELDELPEGGMGLFIMRSFMDEVQYQPGPPNVLRMIKRRGSEDEHARGDEDFPPLSSDSSASLAEEVPPSSGGTFRIDAVEGEGDWTSATWVNEGAALGAHGSDPTPRIAARLAGGSRRT
jgi:serine/threonine-protein kinase RsbW